MKDTDLIRFGMTPSSHATIHLLKMNALFPLPSGYKLLRARIVFSPHL